MVAEISTVGTRPFWAVGRFYCASLQVGRAGRSRGSMGRRAGWKTASGDVVPFERIDPDRHNRQRCAATIPPRTAGCGRTAAAD